MVEWIISTSNTSNSNWDFFAYSISFGHRIVNSDESGHGDNNLFIADSNAAIQCFDDSDLRRRFHHGQQQRQP